MTNSAAVHKSLRQELAELRRQHLGLAPDNAFLLWYLTARFFSSADYRDAKKWLSGGPNDKGFDAIVVQNDRKVAYLIQGKYRTTFGKPENISAIYKLADDARYALSSDKDQFEKFVIGATPQAKKNIDLVRKVVLKENFTLHLVFITTGTVSEKNQKLAKRYSRSQVKGAKFEIVSLEDVERLYRLYLEGAAPPTPTITLNMEKNTQWGRRTDKKLGLTSYFFSADARSVAQAYQVADVRLFDKNIRGFLGQSKVNGEMADTLKSDPGYFFHFNNGVTVIGDKVTPVGDSIEIEAPQVINGQQTVRTLASNANSLINANVIVKAIELPSTFQHKRDQFIANLVAATNWQNTISLMDLHANDAVQINLERSLINLNYLYLRKRQTRGEARRDHGPGYLILKKEDLAKAVGACELDPWDVRSGVKHLFEKHYKKIFSYRSPYDYLSRYWIVKSVEVVAKGKPGRAYAKWLVSRFVWQLISSSLTKESAKRALVESLADQNGGSQMLARAIDQVFSAAKAYYNDSDTDLDISRFYRDRREHHTHFSSYWRRYDATKKAKVKKAVTEFLRQAT